MAPRVRPLARYIVEMGFEEEMAVPNTRSILTELPITGGGDLSADVTIGFADSPLSLLGDGAANFDEPAQNNRGASPHVFGIAEGTALVPVTDANPTISIQRYEATNDGVGNTIIGFQYTTEKTAGNSIIVGLDSFLRDDSDTSTSGIALAGRVSVGADTPILNKTVWALWALADRTHVDNRICGAEIDCSNNTGVDAPDDDTTPNSCLGIQVVATGNAMSSTGIEITTGTPGTAGFMTGIRFMPQCVINCGIDFRYIPDAIPIRLANNTVIVGRNSADTGDASIIGFDSNDQIQLGAGGQFVSVGSISAALAPVHIISDFGNTNILTQNNGGLAGVEAQSFASTGASAAGGFIARRARGTIASPANVQKLDRLGFFVMGGWADGAYHNTASIEAKVLENSPSSTSLATGMIFSTTPDGSVTRVPCFELTPTGTASFSGHIASSSLSPPSMTAGPALGTDPTTAISGSDISGTLLLTTGTSCATGDIVVTVTFNVEYESTPRAVILTPANAAAANFLTGSTSGAFWVDQASTTTTEFVIRVGSLALSDTTEYRFSYMVI